MATLAYRDILQIQNAKRKPAFSKTVGSATYHTNVAIVSTISVYAVQFPQSIATYLKKVSQIRVEDQKKTQTMTQKM